MKSEFSSDENDKEAKARCSLYIMRFEAADNRIRYPRSESAALDTKM